MADNSKIEWTDASWNPIRACHRQSGKVGWHCEHATTGCVNCYAEGFNLRLGTGLPFKPGHRKDIDLFLDERTLLQPLRWKRPRMVFVCSMTDLFAEFVPDEWIDRVFAVMALCPQHTFQVLTKRSQRMREYTSDISSNPIGRGGLHHRLSRALEALGSQASPADVRSQLPLRNVWLGVSAERQPEWDERTEDLENTPAAVRFVSIEPMLGPIQARGRLLSCRMPADCECGHGHGFSRCPNTGGVSPNCHKCDCRAFRKKPGSDTGTHWIIGGGESGPGARPMHPDWVRSIRDQCQAAGVAFFFKQWGAFAPGSGEPLLRDRGAWLLPDGEVVSPVRPRPPCAIFMSKESVDRQRAGRLLDGREWNEMPSPQRAPAMETA